MSAATTQLDALVRRGYDSQLSWPTVQRFVNGTQVTTIYPDLTQGFKDACAGEEQTRRQKGKWMTMAARACKTAGYDDQPKYTNDFEVLKDISRAHFMELSGTSQIQPHPEAIAEALLDELDEGGRRVGTPKRYPPITPGSEAPESAFESAYYWVTSLFSDKSAPEGDGST